MILLGTFFSGIGSQEMALRDLGVDFKVDFSCEWEVNAIASYKAIHFQNDNTDYSAELTKEELVAILYGLGISNDGKNPMPMDTITRKNEAWLRTTYNNIQATRNLVNIMKVHGWDLVGGTKYKRWWTYSFPCQDLSVAGKQAGMTKGSGTRSGLLWELERILAEIVAVGGNLPDVLIMENVPQVHGKNNLKDFESWLAFLDSIGYHSVWQDLNAKDYGVAQSRNRCYCISLLDAKREYSFPTSFELTKTMEDYLDEDVPEQFYVTSDKAHELIDKLVVEGKIPLPEDEEELNTADSDGVIAEDMMNLLMGIEACPTRQ